MTVLTKKAAFVLEIKTWARSIKTAAPFEFIESKGTDSTPAGKDLSGVLRQNATHAETFAMLSPSYPFDFIYEQAVFVEPKEFITDSCEFIDNVNVSCLSKDGTWDFAAAMNQELSKLEERLSDDEVAHLGERLLNTYGDLNQKTICRARPCAWLLTFNKRFHGKDNNDQHAHRPQSPKNSQDIPTQRSLPRRTNSGVALFQPRQNPHPTGYAYFSFAPQKRNARRAARHLIVHSASVRVAR